MRKAQRKKILELLRTLDEANVELGRLCARGEDAAMLQVLTDCQSCVIGIGSYIDSTEGEGTETVALLEAYCELLYQASKGEIKEKQLRKHLIKIENSVTLEFECKRIEIVFLIYKASMSDSLESIYLAAQADPDCDAYWIPIPHFELNADGSLGEMHYEGAESYGENIVCTDWREYKLEARNPDVIFIHYAYDNNVSNASIHPEFYSKRLREHCELLLYVPYFVATGEAVDEYCGYLPGVLYAHHVIVESEAVRKSYIEHYKRFDKQLGWKGKFGKAEKKFIVLGSPKFDKAINARREDYELPLEWKRFVDKPDGSRKKVVFYNTHMFAWIKNGEAYFEKLRFVFNLFRDRGDAVLWWRPHPNTELNFKVKRPQWLKEYYAVIDEYRRGGFGIYDDTPDLHRALAWSDVYYGDGSSVTKLFEACGKPVIFQAAGKSLNNEFLNFSSVTAHDGYLYLTDNYLNNVIWKLDLKDLKLKFFLGLPDYPFNQFLQFHNVKLRDGKCYILPFYGDSVAVYDMESGLVESIPIPVDDALKNESKGGLTHLCNFFYKDRIFLFPFRYKAIISINLASREVTMHTGWVEEMRSKGFDVDGKLFELHTMLDETRVLLPSLSSNCVLEFDLETGASTAHQVGGTDISFSGSFLYNGIVWLVCYNKPLVLKWNMETSSTVALDITDEEFSSYGPPFSTNAVQWNQFLFLFPKCSNIVFKINMETDEITKIDAFDPYCVSKPDRKMINMFDGVIVQDDWIYANSDNTQKVFLYHVPTNALTVLDKNDLRRTISEADYEKTASTVIKSLDAEHKPQNSSESDIDGTAGQTIFRFAKEQIFG